MRHSWGGPPSDKIRNPPAVPVDTSKLQALMQGKKNTTTTMKTDSNMGQKHSPDFMIISFAFFRK